MHFTVVQKVVGGLLMLFSITTVPPLLVSGLYGDPAGGAFIEAGLIMAVTGFAVWFPVRNARWPLRLREGFLVTTMFWTVLGMAAGLPLMLADASNLSFTDATFESISGFTTTGSTVMTGLDALPRSLQFYRQELQWLGGMGIIVLAVAILPMLGIGGMQLYRAEVPGPVKDAKLTPRITETAKALWYLYLGLTVLCALAYWLGGMSVFDAVGHSFSTLSTGGYSPYDASFGEFDSSLLEAIAIVFMVLGGANFGLHFIALRRRTLGHYVHDAEFRTYIGILVGFSLVTAAYLWIAHTYSTLFPDLLEGTFQVVSVMTTTGYTTASFAHWPAFIPVLLMFASIIGGCASSTGGGLKVIRVLLLFKQGRRELTRLVHPNALVPVKIGGTPLDNRVVDGIWGFFSTYVLCYALSMLLLMAAGLDQVTAFSAVAATINNMGPGLGSVAANFQSLGDFSKWVLIIDMLLGRLEVFTVLVLLTPDFWRS